VCRLFHFSKIFIYPLILYISFVHEENPSKEMQKIFSKIQQIGKISQSIKDLSVCHQF